MSKTSQLQDISKSKKSYIIYKSTKGFDLYTDFSKKIVLNKKNIFNFLNEIKPTKRFKETDLFIGFFGYELLNSLIGVKVPQQRDINFPKGIFYKPEKKISLNNKLIYNPKIKTCFKKKFKINIDSQNYRKIFDKFKKKIKSGETYQIKICTKYKMKSKIDPLDLFCRLSHTNLAPETFMIKDENYSIISCSPENLITKIGSVVTTKPIAGTVKKSKKMTKNKALKYFRSNLKETKEHNMIVDMERSDISRICKVGSVRLIKEKVVEEYKDLFHYVSLIKGELKKKVKNIDIIRAMMPGGSVIGCPKISTLNLLNNQEKENRNIYTGSFGYIKFNGDLKFNIIIRSILNFKNISEISVASGVVVDSNSRHEFNENYIKAKALIDLFK